jgi:DNA-binding transcriptional LysR family regulator
MHLQKNAEICRSIMQKCRPMNWNDLRYVLATARAGSLAAAARRLGVDQTTVARRLAVADTALAARLFDRVGGKLRLTRAGRATVARAIRIEREVEALGSKTGAARGEISGRVRVTTVPILANRLLVPAMPALFERHPKIEIELLAEARNANLSQGEADIALRLARPEGGGTTLARRVASLAYAVYAPKTKSAERLAWIGYAEGLAHLPHARWLARESKRGGAAALLIDDAEAAVQAVHAGLGKTLLPCLIAERDPLLRRIGRPTPVVTRELWMLTHPDWRRHAAVAATVAWLEALLKTPRRS